ncbi:MBL fold metallo-hydrolase [Lentisphaerota bacterium ZTH]|nr:MBL fold metallo-hydrolase [Lentisphaerota bacterium]WET07355.1 MBL fold metallo-hydrolase [Lentisphaerota bacterium ZTH]
MSSSEYNVFQLKVGGFDDNFSYLITAENGDSIIIDPCGDTGIIKTAFKRRKKLNPRYILLTHSHQDHISGIKAVQKFFDAEVYAHPKTAWHGAQPLSDHQKLPFGKGYIEVIFTPGHTRDCVCYRLHDNSALFTGDTLFIDWCGYCNAFEMYETMRKIIFPMADSNIVYSGHDYGRVPYATLGEEKLKNPYLNAASFAEFKEALKNL